MKDKHFRVIYLQKGEEMATAITASNRQNAMHKAAKQLGVTVMRAFLIKE